MSEIEGMARINQMLFSISLLALSWLAMMAIHELGHVVGAVITGGTVERVVLHAFAISRTDVAPNPHPAVVVWLGPGIGCMLPLIMFMLVPRRLTVFRIVARFFAGLCLVANGAYIGLGSFNQVGDCGEMLRTGTPLWPMLAFGAVAVALGVYLWHGLGSLVHFITNPKLVTPPMACAAFGVLLAGVIASVVLSAN